MNKAHIERTLKSLKDRCINKIDESFNLYLLNDVNEAGEVDQLFDRESWYLYYLDCAKEVNQIINILLNDSLKNKGKLLEAISIKRLTDGKLIEYGNGDYPVIFGDLGFNVVYEEFIVVNRDKVLNYEGFLNNLWKRLTTKKWLANSFDEFYSHFKQSENQSVIQWNSTQNDVVGFIKYLVENQYIIINTGRPVDLIKRHFRLNGKIFKERSLEVSYSKIFTNDSLEGRFKFIDECNNSQYETDIKN